MNPLCELSQSEQDKRFKAITSVLDSMGVEYRIQDYISGKNIIVSTHGKKSNLLVIGAHWDSFKGSTGANDNASSCWILLRLIASLYGSTNKRIDFVFFDGEERGATGSTAYIESKKNPKEKICAMVNLDVCGFGEYIGIKENPNTRNNKHFYNITSDKNINKHKVNCLHYFGIGDDVNFSCNEIPCISVSAMDKSTLDYFWYKGNWNNGVEFDGTYNHREPMVFSTMHNRENDNVEIVCQSSMDMVFQFLLDGL